MEARPNLSIVKVDGSNAIKLHIIEHLLSKLKIIGEAVKAQPFLEKNDGWN